MSISGQSEAEKLIDATMPLTLRPKQEDRARVLSAALRYVLNNLSGCDSDGNTVVSAERLRDLVADLDDYAAKGGGHRGISRGYANKVRKASDSCSSVWCGICQSIRYFDE